MLTIIILLLMQATVGETISGEIRGPDGQPRSGIRVSALEAPDSQNADGRIVSFDTTDSHGRYRIAGVGPGRYHVMAGPLAFPTYYPGANALSAAAIVTVVPGKPVSSIDFPVLRMGWKIEGRVFPAGPDVPTPKKVLLQETQAVVAGPEGVYRQTTVDADGWFEFSDVLPGDYWIVADPPGLVPRAGLITAANLAKRGQLTITVKGDVGGVALTGSAPTSANPLAPCEGMPRGAGALTASSSPVRVSCELLMALCLSCPQPTFPSLAKTAVVSDTVVLSVVVEKDGNVRDVRVTRGHQLLQQAAVDAVRRWRFKPVMLNGEPVEVEAPIPIPFLMN